jgi:hypothetical protein
MTPAPTTDPIKDRAPRTDSLPMLARARLFALVGLLPLSCLNVPPPDASGTDTGTSVPSTLDASGDGEVSGGGTADETGGDDGDDEGTKLDIGPADGTADAGTGSSSTGSGSDTSTGDDTAGTSTGATTGDDSGTTSEGSSSSTGD